MLVILFVVGIPILLSLRESVFRKATTVDPITGMIPEGESFVGLANFTDIFTNPRQCPVCGGRWTGWSTPSGT